MTDYELVKQTLDKVNIDYTDVPNFLGYSIIIEVKQVKIHFEFDTEGKYNSVM